MYYLNILYCNVLSEDSCPASALQHYKRRREGAESGVVLLSVRYGTIGLCIRSKRGAAFSEAFSHSKLLSTKNEPQEKS